jgi:hypothetical protein
MKSALCDWLLGCALAAHAPVSAPDLNYGAVLFAYENGDHAQALVEALIGQAQPELSHDDRARFALAAEIIALEDDVPLARLIPKPDLDALTSEQHVRRAVARARACYRHQHWQALGEAIDEFDHSVTGLAAENPHRSEYVVEMAHLRAEWTTANGRFDVAETLIAQLPVKDSRRAYALFNLGVAMYAAGAARQAQSVLTNLAGLDVYTADALDLKQRAQLALALISVQQTKSASAEALLSDIPAHSRYNAGALATYGGLAMDDGDYALAARVWTTLEQRELWSPAGVTARLALPLSLEHIAAPESALAQFRVAESAYLARLNDLGRLTRQLDDAEWVATLLRSMARAFLGGAPNRTLREFQDALGHQEWTQWFAAQDVQARLAQLPALDRMIAWLVMAEHQLPALAAVVQADGERVAAVRAGLGAVNLDARRARMRDGLDQLVRRLDALQRAEPVPTADWMLPMADARQADFMTQTASLRRRIEQLGSESERRELCSQLERIEGVLFWQIADEGGARLSATAERAADLAAQLGTLDTSRRGLEHQMLGFDTAAGTDVAGIAPRISTLRDKLAHFATRNEEALAALIRKQIELETVQVDRQLALTRVAIVRAMDSVVNRENSKQ